MNARSEKNRESQPLKSELKITKEPARIVNSEKEINVGQSRKSEDLEVNENFCERLTMMQVKTQRRHLDKRYIRVINVIEYKVDTQEYAVERVVENPKWKGIKYYIVRWYRYTSKTRRRETTGTSTTPLFLKTLKADRQGNGSRNRPSQRVTSGGDISVWRRDRGGKNRDRAINDSRPRQQQPRRRNEWLANRLSERQTKRTQNSMIWNLKWRTQTG